MSRSLIHLTETYGPIASIRRGNGVQIVVGTYQVSVCSLLFLPGSTLIWFQAAMDIMQRHGSDLADRPPAVSASDILSGGKRILLLRAGKRMVAYRRYVFPSMALPCLILSECTPLPERCTRRYSLWHRHSTNRSSIKTRRTTSSTSFGTRRTIWRTLESTCRIHHI